MRLLRKILAVLCAFLCLPVSTACSHEEDVDTVLENLYGDYVGEGLEVLSLSSSQSLLTVGEWFVGETFRLRKDEVLLPNDPHRKTRIADEANPRFEIRKMTENDDKYFPYSFGQGMPETEGPTDSLWKKVKPERDGLPWQEKKLDISSVKRRYIIEIYGDGDNAPDRRLCTFYLLDGRLYLDYVFCLFKLAKVD